MAQRESGYERVPADLYETPAWVTCALAEHLPLTGTAIWEPACGTGKMVTALYDAGVRNVRSTDVEDHGFSGLAYRADFLRERYPTMSIYKHEGIVTNPPYGQRGKLATAFAERCVHHIEAGDCRFAALLLQSDFDAAKTRRHLFADSPYFSGRVTLLKRVKWFEDPEKKNMGPSANHAWFIWEANTEYPFGLKYAPLNDA